MPFDLQKDLEKEKYKLVKTGHLGSIPDVGAFFQR